MFSRFRTDQSEELARRIGWRDRRPMVLAGLGALAVAAGILMLFGEVSAASRATVLEGLNDSLFWLAGAMIGACATIAALMLTTLTLMPHLETRRMTPRFLYNFRLTVLGALATIGLAILCLLLTVFPAAGTEQFTPSQAEINVLYFTLLGLSALMIGGFAVVLVSLYQTIADVFRHLPHEWVEDILAEEEVEEAEAETAGAQAEAEAERRRRERCEETCEESPSRPATAFPTATRSRRVAVR
jgi:hypothetical protein